MQATTAIREFQKCYSKKLKPTKLELKKAKAEADCRAKQLREQAVKDKLAICDILEKEEEPLEDLEEEPEVITPQQRKNNTTDLRQSTRKGKIVTFA